MGSSRILLAAAALAVGCAAPRAYPGPELPQSEVGLVHGAVRAIPLTNGSSSVNLVEIDGHAEIGSRKGPALTAEAPAGLREFTVRHGL
jgi:hypothetical protein